MTFHCNSLVFQSTPPVKAATVKSQIIPPITAFQSTPPVKAATIDINYEHTLYFISIHAAREGGDADTQDTAVLTAAFQSTPPVKAAT